MSAGGLETKSTLLRIIPILRKGSQMTPNHSPGDWHLYKKPKYFSSYFLNEIFPPSFFTLSGK